MSWRETATKRGVSAAWFGRSKLLRLAVPSAPQDDTEEAVTVAEAARRLGCATSTVRDLLDRGQLSGHRVGAGNKPRGVRVHVEAIRRYKARHSIGAAPAPAEAQPSRRMSRSPGAAEARRWLRERGML
jgi:excisionase family DNA binding protein